jgi:hypothetical protein
LTRNKWLIPIASSANISVAGKGRVLRHLFIRRAGGITEFTSRDPFCLAQRRRDALLHQDGIFDPNTLCVFNDLAMTNDRIHFGFCNLLRVARQGS